MGCVEAFLAAYAFARESICGFCLPSIRFFTAVRRLSRLLFHVVLVQAAIVAIRLALARHIVRRAKLYAPVAPAGHGLPFRSFDEPKRREPIIATASAIPAGEKDGYTAAVNSGRKPRVVFAGIENNLAAIRQKKDLTAFINEQPVIDAEQTLRSLC